MSYWKLNHFFTPACAMKISIEGFSLLIIVALFCLFVGIWSGLQTEFAIKNWGEFFFRKSPKWSSGLCCWKVSVHSAHILRRYLGIIVSSGKRKWPAATLQRHHRPFPGSFSELVMFRFPKMWQQCIDILHAGFRQFWQNIS